MVKIATRQPDEGYVGDVYMLKVTPDSDWPVTPSQEPPEDSEGKTPWHRVRNPYMTLDTLE